MKPFLILQLRPLDAAAESEFQAFLQYGGLTEEQVQRVRMEEESIVELQASEYAGIIVGGGPSNVSDDPSIKPEYQIRFERELDMLLDQVVEEDIPYMGSCYGFGALAHHQGGEISKARYGEPVGQVNIFLNSAGKRDPLLAGFSDEFIALTGHKEACQFVPEGGELLASSPYCPVQVLRFKQNIYATQFHTELDVQGIIDRIKFYKHHGYFPPEEAQTLIERVTDAKVIVPQKILRRFVDRYRLK